jgi:tRNA dimethylallyltransferase
MHELITILGPTATGKTRLAAMLAAQTDAEIISADSRQVYRGMDLGTGKDLEDYLVEGVQVPVHLIDIALPGEEYNVFRFQEDFLRTYSDIRLRGKRAIMCGGTGLYLESVLMGYDLPEAPVNTNLRKKLDHLSTAELIEKLAKSRALHNISDTGDRRRLIRAIEIEESRMTGQSLPKPFPPLRHHVFGISLPREMVRERITRRLKQRLDQGMDDEVRRLLKEGIQPSQLEFYGLEYKCLTQYVCGRISRDEMFEKLNTAIHQFAKRQMTWFRRMERKGVHIRWIDGRMTMQEKLQSVIRHL